MNYFLQNNDCICSILKSKDVIYDGLISTQTHALYKSHLPVYSVEMYFNVLSELRHNNFSKFDNHCRFEMISLSLTVRKLKSDLALLSLKSEVSHFSVCVLYSSTLSRFFLPL